MDIGGMQGRQIRQVWWPDTECEQGRYLTATDTTIIEMSVAPNGDFWIVEFESMGGEFRETARHNARYVESFDWV